MKIHTLLTLIVLPALPAAIATYVGITHNAMQEFCKNDPEAGGQCILDLGYTTIVFSTWYALAFLIIALVLLALGLVARNRKKHSE